MSISVGKYNFEGPYMDTSKLQNRAGVYAIHCLSNSVYTLIDVGESANVKERIDSHERKGCWESNCSDVLVVSVLYTPFLQPSDRQAIEYIIRKQLDPPCGRK